MVLTGREGREEGREIRLDWRITNFKFKNNKKNMVVGKNRVTEWENSILVFSHSLSENGKTCMRRKRSSDLTLAGVTETT